MVPIKVLRIPHLAQEAEHWGKVLMSPTKERTNTFSTKNIKPGGADVYLRALHDMFL
ncbi:hypothetical protein HQ487_04970 [Candidatus Uhrbacteria bacterium]|nr:hypothetical protein [Candidatus Uhrbacteria bacterium]